MSWKNKHVVQLKKVICSLSWRILSGGLTVSWKLTFHFKRRNLLRPDSGVVKFLHLVAVRLLLFLTSQVLASMVVLHDQGSLASEERPKTSFMMFTLCTRLTLLSRRSSSLSPSKLLYCCLLCYCCCSKDDPCSALLTDTDLAPLCHTYFTH